ncbi:MAG: PQQ-binding-like beta-propeller repeat protein [Planctomycetes bacterium]|nr:PQQ-binding-like beta-propeller repeat protein [Planctomycetota bacterium]
MTMKKFAFFLLILFPGHLTFAEDWNTWRHDNQHSGISNEELPENLKLIWARQLPKPSPAWNDSRLQFDKSIHLVISGSTTYVNTPDLEGVRAYHADSGKEIWRFNANGPVRVAPCIAGINILIACDDGFLYCLDKKTGNIKWKFFAGHNEKRTLGNGKLISIWPVRGGPVVENGVVYCAAGVWPFMGTIIYAIDLNTGHEIWRNEETSLMYFEQDGAGEGYGFGGPSPQGSIAINGENLVIPAGRAWPMQINKTTGKLLPYYPGVKDHGGGGSVRISVYDDYLTMGGFVFSLKNFLPLSFNDKAKFLKPFSALSLIDQEVLYSVSEQQFTAFSLKQPELKLYRGGFGVQALQATAPKLWEFTHDKPLMTFIKSGSKIYASTESEILAIKVESELDEKRVAWSIDTPDTVLELAAANGKLYASTKGGWVYCYGTGNGEPKVYSRPKQELPQADIWQEKVLRLKEKLSLNEGYCLVTGLKDGELLRALVKNTQLKIIAIDQHSELVNRLRVEYEEAGLLGNRVILHQGSPLEFEYPQYLAKLIISEYSYESNHSFFENLITKTYSSLRPFGGALAINVPASKQDRFTSMIQPMTLEKMDLSRQDDWTLLIRSGALAGSDDWTHESGNPGNTWKNNDKLVKAPLGVLWYGGSAGADELFMHKDKDPSTPQIVDGRMFIHGERVMTSIDIYTGQIIWKKKIPAARLFRNDRTNVTGIKPWNTRAGTRPARSDFVADKQGLFLVLGQKIVRWDSATGKEIQSYVVPPELPGGRSPHIGQLKIKGHVMIVSAGYEAPELGATFVTDDFEALSKEELKTTLSRLKTWLPENIVNRNKDEQDLEYLTRYANHLLSQKELEKKVLPSVQSQPLDTTQLEKLSNTKKSFEHYYQIQKQYFAPFLSLRDLNRKLIEAAFPDIKTMPLKTNWDNERYWRGAATKQIVAIDINSGKVLWRKISNYGFPHKSVAIGNGRVFCLDRIDIATLELTKRRGVAVEHTPRVLSYDLQTGREVWTQTDNGLSYQTLYSDQHDIFLQISPYDLDPEAINRKKRRQGLRFVAHQGTNGKVIWQRDFEVNRAVGRHRAWYSWFLYKDMVVCETYKDYTDENSDFHGIDLKTGKFVNRVDPITGETKDWVIARTRGCGNSVCSENLIFFRSGSAGYFNMENDGGTSNLGGFRSGCKNSLIPAGGILNAPNIASGCSCNYPIFTSLALVTMKGVENWTSNEMVYQGEKIKRLGINLGAPGDYKAKKGTLWVDYPSKGGPSPKVPVKVTPENPAWFYHHSARVQGPHAGFVTGSGALGLEKISILLGDKNRKGVYTVRLFFSENKGASTGDRIQTISIQNKPVLKNYDILKEVSLPGVGVVKEFKNIKITNGELLIGLTADVGKTLLCGIEVIEQ